MPNMVTQSMLDYIRLESQIGGYEAAAREATLIQQFYGQAARLFRCKESNIAFTASATDSFTRALSSIPFVPGDVIVTDNDNFVSNQIQFLSCAKRLGVKIVRVNNASVGGIDLEDLEKKLIRYTPRLLSITHIPTNSGLIQPVKEIATIYRRYSLSYPDKTWYILDGCQSAGQMTLDVNALACDFLSVTGRKFLRGPRGTGILYVNDRALQAGLEPMFIDMRGAEWKEKDRYEPRETAMRFEDWEFAYATVVGTKEAIEYCLTLGEDRIEQQIKWLSSSLRTKLAALDGLRVLDRGPDLGGLVTFNVARSSAQYIVDEMHKRKINVVSSYRAFGVIDFDEKGVTWAVRASPHYYNTPEEIELFVDALKEIIG